MIPEIIRHIDNNAELSAVFQRMTEEAYDEQELAGAIAAWFEIEHANSNLSNYSEDNYDCRESIENLLDAILKQAILSITSDQWLTIAQHLWTRYWNGRTANTSIFYN